MERHLHANGIKGFCFFIVPRFHGAEGPKARGPSELGAAMPAAGGASPPDPSDCPPVAGCTSVAASQHPVSLFVRGFRSGSDGIVEELLQAVRDVGVKGCTARSLDLLSDRCALTTLTGPSVVSSAMHRTHIWIHQI